MSRGRRRYSGKLRSARSSRAGSSGGRLRRGGLREVEAGGFCFSGSGSELLQVSKVASLRIRYQLNGSRWRRSQAHLLLPQPPEQSQTRNRKNSHHRSSNHPRIDTPSRRRRGALDTLDRGALRACSERSASACSHGNTGVTHREVRIHCSPLAQLQAGVEPSHATQVSRAKRDIADENQGESWSGMSRGLLENTVLTGRL